MAGVEIKVRANTREARSDLSRLQTSLGNLERNAQSVTSTFRKLAIGISAAFGAVQFTRTFNNAADSVTNLENKLALVVGRGEKTAKTLDELYKIAARSRSSVDSAAETFNRFGLALADSDKPVEELLKVTEAVNKAAVISGASSESAKAAIIQLGQGLASGQLRGQELNSVLEQTPRLARAIATGMKIPFGELREQAAQGKITAEAVYQAILDDAKNINDEFLLLNATVGDLSVVMSNEFTRAVAEIDKAVGFSERAKASIISLTNAFRFVGANVERWQLQTQLAFLVVESQIKDLIHNVKESLGQLFSTDFNAEEFLDSIIETGQKAKEKAKSVFGEAIKPRIEAIKLDVVFPDLSKVESRLAQFKKNIIDLFWAIHSRIVGKSLWTGIFDPGHMEPGQKLAIGSSISSYLEVPLANLNVWKTKLVGLFGNLYDEVMLKWNALTLELTNRSLTPSTISFQAVKTEFDTILASMEERYEDFKAKSYGAQIDQKFQSLKDNFKSATDFMTSNYDTFIGAVKNTPLVVGAVELSKSVVEDLEGLSTSIQDFFASNSDVLAAAVAGALGIALNSSLRGMALTGGILGALVYATGQLGNNAEFLEAARTTASGFGKAVGATMGEGDFIGELITGTVRLAHAVASGFVDGFFGDGILNNGLTDGLATALTVAVGALTVSSWLRGKAVSTIATFGPALAKKMFGATFALSAKTQMGKKIGDGILELRTNPKLHGHAKGLGTKLGNMMTGGMGTVLNGGLNAIIAKEFADAIIPDDALGGAGEALDGAIGGAALGASLGSVIPGIGTAVGAAVGGAIGLAFDVLNNKELMDGIRGIGDTLYDIVFVEFPRAIVEGFKSIGEQVKGILKDMFSGIGSYFEAPAWLKRFTGTDGAEDGGQGDDGKKKLASGGYVSGPGGPTEDKIPAMLSNGEYVIRAAAVKKLGIGRLDELNQGRLPRYATGGLVGIQKFSGGGLVGQAQKEIKDSFARGDTGTAMEMISVLEKLGKLDEALEGMDDATKEATKEMKKKNDEEKKGDKEKKEKEDKAASEAASAFAGAFGGHLSDYLRTGNMKSFIDSMLDTLTNSIIDSFSEGFAEAFVGEGGFMGLFDASGIGSSLGGLLGGIGGGIGSLFSLFSGGSLLGFSQGGIVPSTPYSQAGKDSVPAMLMPGEVVLSKNDLRSMNSNSSKSEQVFNINVSGDISRQTRKEIVKMMPEITSGVNYQNRESNFRP